MLTNAIYVKGGQLHSRGKPQTTSPDSHKSGQEKKLKSWKILDEFNEFKQTSDEKQQIPNESLHHELQFGRKINEFWILKNKLWIDEFFLF